MISKDFATRSIVPLFSDRQAWQTLTASDLGQKRVAATVNAATLALVEPWPALPATLYMDLSRSGRRDRFEAAFFARRHRLGLFVLAALTTGEARWIDPIADAVWSICEESTWCVPSHSGQRRPERTVLPLPHVDGQMVDLFTGETSAVLAETIALCGAELDLVAPQIRQRVQAEVHCRFLEPFLGPENFWWRRGLNNWTAWIASNAVIATANLGNDAELAAVTDVAMTLVQRYLATQPADGACDEGIGYWSVGPGSLLLLDEELRRRSAGASGINDPRLIEMALFPLRAHLGYGRFPTFADTVPGSQPRPHLMARAATVAKEPGLEDLAWLCLRGGNPDAQPDPTPSGGHKVSGATLTHGLRSWAWMAHENVKENTSEKSSDYWFPETQVWIRRRSGLALSAKSGHNSENHNHNDCGQFELLLDGKPLIVDAGTGAYDGTSFSGRRYERWFVRSSGHGVPRINGVEQAAGRRYTPDEVRRLNEEGPLALLNHRPFTCRDVSFEKSNESTVLRMDLAGCYPADSGIREALRTITAKGDVVTIDDTITVANGPLRVEVPLLCTVEPLAQTDGSWHLRQQNGRSLVLRASSADMSVERIPLEDADLRQGWGECLWRLNLVVQVSASSLSLNLRFEGLPQ